MQSLVNHYVAMSLTLQLILPNNQSSARLEMRMYHCLSLADQAIDHRILYPLHVPRQAADDGSNINMKHISQPSCT